MAWLDLSTHRPAPLIARRRSFLRTGPRILLISGQSGPHLNLWDKCGEQVALAIRAERSERSNQPGSRPPLSWTNERAASLRNSPAFRNVAGCKGVRKTAASTARSAQSAASGTISIELSAISASLAGQEEASRVRLNEPNQATVRSQHGRGSNARSGRSARG